MFTVLIFSFSTNFALAEEKQEEPIGDVIMSTDKTAYLPEETIVISGEVTKRKMPLIAIRVFDPEDKILGGYNVELDENNHFTKTITADVPFYEKPGIYTISAEYGKIKSEIIFEIENKLFEEDQILEEDTLEGDKILETEEKPQIVLFETNKLTYHDGDAISITGKVSKMSLPQVTMTVFDSFNTPIGIYLGNVNSDLSFSTSFLAKYNVNFKVFGTYSITAQYGELETKQIRTIQFVETENTQEIPDSLPEETDSIPEVTEPVSDDIDSMPEVTDSTSTSSTLFSESDLQILSSWYYLERTDYELALFFDGLIKRQVLDLDAEISLSVLSEWIKTNDSSIGFMINDLLEDKISEEKFVMSMENSLTKHVENTSHASNEIFPTQIESEYVLETSEPEPVNTEKSENAIVKIENEPMPESEEKITYFYTSVNCEKKTYKDIVLQYNNPGPALAHLCKYEDAIFHYEETLKDEPENIHALTNKGSALANLGKYDDALFYYDKVLEIDPQYLAALNNKGNVFANLGDFQKAVSYYNKVLDIEPHYLPTLENKEIASTSLTVFIENKEPVIQSISHHVVEDTVQGQHIKENKSTDIVTQFTNALSSIGTSLIALFGG